MANRSLVAAALTAAALAALVPRSCLAQPAGDSPGDAEPSELRELVDETVGWYELKGGPDAATPLKSIPVLRWGNNERGSETGLTLLYVADGRPHAVMCVYPWEGELIHEFSSLSEHQVRAALKGNEVWNCERPGVVFRPIPGAGKPTASADGRLLQMKKLVRRFDATLVGWKSDDSDRQELRLLSRPIYRYEPSAGGTDDGAVFAFAMGTDPEVLLLIESTGGDWRYAFARRTSGELQGRLDDAAVWTAERYPNTELVEGTDRSVKWRLSELISRPE